MATRIVPVAEVSERLNSLDMANPAFSETKATKAFERFVKSLKCFPGDPRDLPPIHWLPGTHDYRNRLLDMGIYGGRSSDDFANAMRSYHYAITRALSTEVRIQGRIFHEPPLFAPDYIRHLRQVAEPLCPIGQWNFIYCDENFLEAFEAGLGFFVVQQRDIILFPRPIIRRRQEISEMVIHSMIQPAIQYPDDPTSDQFWIRGIRVPRFVVMNPERITRAHIRAARTVALRATMIDQYGLLKYSIERGFKPVSDSEEYGAILYVKGGKPRNRWDGPSQRECVVELINSTPEPDGTRRRFARRVPSNMETAHQAVAWTFGFENASDYRPVIQT